MFAVARAIERRSRSVMKLRTSDELYQSFCERPGGHGSESVDAELGALLSPLANACRARKDGEPVLGLDLDASGMSNPSPAIPGFAKVDAARCARVLSGCDAT